MIVQISDGPDKTLSVYFIAENEYEQRDLYLLATSMKNKPKFHLDSYVSTIANGAEGANNVLLVTEKKRVRSAKRRKR